MNKKVGILTYHYIYNYGAQLQALATSLALRKLGYEPIILNYIHEDVIEKKYKKLVTPEQQEVHNKFLKEYLPVSKVCYSPDDIIQLVDDLNLKNIIVGSDAVFLITQGYNKFTNTTHPTIYWMGWLRKCKDYKNIKVFGLSVSAMDTNFMKLPKNQKKDLAENLDLFNKVYNRDLWVKLFIKYLRPFKKVKRSPDPVLAFSSLFPKETLDKIDIPIKGKYVLYGFGEKEGRNSREKLTEIKKEVNQLGYKFIDLPFPEGNFNDLSDVDFKSPLNPLQWYKLIKNSSAYIGEKFHPVIIAMHNEVPFYAVDRNADRVSKKFIIPIRMKFQSKTWDTCKYYKFPKAFVPFSEFDKTSTKEIINLLFNKKWSFLKVKKMETRFIDIIKDFKI